MKNPVIPENVGKKLLYKCMIPTCNKQVEGWYGAWGDKGTCSKACETIQRKSVAEKRLLDHSTYLLKFNLKE